MKTVFNNAADVIHLFAQQTQDNARSSNVFFKGDKIYSYGLHYELARFVNPQTILINDTGCSVTTSKHVSIVTSATRQYNQYFLTQIDSRLVGMQLENLIEKLAKARKPEKYCLEIEKVLNVYFNSLEILKVPENSSPAAEIEHNRILIIKEQYEKEKKYFSLSEYKDKIAKFEKEKAKKEKAKRLKDYKKDIKDFLNYKIDSFYHQLEDFIRISKDEKSVETSQYVKIDIKEAATLYRLIKAGKPVHGVKIGSYTVQGLNGVLTVGCHKINKKNMETVGEEVLNILNN